MLSKCPYCEIELTKCDEDCCGGMIYCRICGRDEDDL